MACTNPEFSKDIGLYELRLMSADDSRRFRAHLLECEDCFRELYEMAPVAELLREGEGAPEGPVALPAAGPVTVARKPERIRLKRWWFAAGAGLAAAAIGFLVIALPDTDRIRLRGERAGSIVVLAPTGEVVVPAQLDWKVVPGAVEYTVRIRPRVGPPIWEETVEQPPAVLPAEAKAKLEPGETYFWEVSARGKGDEAWSSRAIRIEIR